MGVASVLDVQFFFFFFFIKENRICAIPDIINVDSDV